MGTGIDFTANFLIFNISKSMQQRNCIAYYLIYYGFMCILILATKEKAMLFTSLNVFSYSCHKGKGNAYLLLFTNFFVERCSEDALFFLVLKTIVFGWHFWPYRESESLVYL